MDLVYKLLDGNIYEPKFGTKHSGCFDIALPKDIELVPNQWNKIALDIVFNMSSNMRLILYGRSSSAVRHNLITNVSVIDADYKENVHCIILPLSTLEASLKFTAGTRLIQCAVEVIEPVSLIKGNFDSSSSSRHGGFGSTGL